MHVAHNFADLLGRQFGTIYADPPWRFNNAACRGAARKHYPTMSLDDICALPVQSIAAPNAHLHLWVPSALIADGLHVIESWGFTYKSSFV